MEKKTHPSEIKHQGLSYKPVKLLGEGAYGIVYLYASENSQMAVKLAKEDRGRTEISKEGHTLTKLSVNKLQHCIGYFGDGYFNGSPYLKLEVVKYSINEYLVTFAKDKNRLTLPQIAQQA